MEFSSRCQWNEGAPNIEVGGLLWYTDGSKVEIGVGAGVMDPNHTVSYLLGKNANIFQAEVFAIKKCSDIHMRNEYERSKNPALEGRLESLLLSGMTREQK